MKKGLLTSGLLMLLTSAISNPALAQIETLVMPGKVIEAHAEYEEECDSCHKKFERSKQRDLCLDCHEEVASDIADEAGFHGKEPRAKDAACAECHTDHEGRNADITGLDERQFDHQYTDFPLIGRHARNACSDCHAPSTRHRETSSECFSCHEDNNPHAESMGTVCGDCHTPTGWLDVEFDHDTTNFPLVGKHQEPACLDCHADRTFSDTPSTCFGCHAEDDAHDGLSGNECGNCHKPTGWQDTSFDHARDTDFARDGKHAEQTCDACHSDDPFSDRLSTNCFSCHEENDNHEGHFGEACDTCHVSSGWPEVRFDHAIDTGHALLGAHSEAECKACHIEPVFAVELNADCFSCHEGDEPHEESLGTGCKECHNELAWQEEVFFDHGLARFPLLGKHNDAECDACHESHVFRDAPENCADCHYDDDSHKGLFGNDCGLCHNPVEWQKTSFDHDRQTDFALTGAHRDVACESCHRRPLEGHAKLGRYCADCHKSSDVHDGEFGRDCERCHSSESFREVRRIR